MMVLALPLMSIHLRVTTKAKTHATIKKWFAHLAIMDVQKAKTEWKEPVSEKEYTQLTK